jgi:hypothetical protein
MMKDRLSGQIDLAGLFGTGAAPLSIKTLALQGDDVARDAEAICAVIGSPRSGTEVPQPFRAPAVLPRNF